MGCWGADVVHDLFDKSLYYRSTNDLLDAFTYFGMSCYVYVYIILYTLTSGDVHYRVYANRTQAKKIITILTFARFSGKGRYLLH